MPLDMNLLDASLVDRIFCNSFKRYNILKRSRPSMARSWRQASALPIYLMERWLGWTGWAGWDGLAGLGCQGHIVLLRNFIDFDSFWVNFCRMPLAKPSFFRIHFFLRGEELSGCPKCGLAGPLGQPSQPPETFPPPKKRI